MKAVIIDDGVYKKGVKQYTVTEDNKIISVEFDSWVYSHGTLCFDILSSVAKNVELISIQAGETDDNGAMHTDKLITALNWCLNHEISVISLSIGTSNLLEFHKFEDVLNQLIEKHIIVVAALNNENILTFPASRKGILGVRYDKNHVLPKGKFAWLKNDLLGTDILVHPDIDKGILAKMGDQEANSYATPYMAGLICNHMREQAGHESGIMAWIKANSNCFHQEYLIQNTLENVTEKEEPINIAIYSPREELFRLGEKFRKQGYVSLDMELKEECICRNTKIEFEQDHWEKDYEVLIEIGNPDVILWFISESFEIARMKTLHDVIIVNENSAVSEELTTYLRQEGEMLVYSESEMNSERVFHDLLRLLM